MKHLAINWMTDVKDHILKTRKYCLEKLKNTLQNEELECSCFKKLDITKISVVSQLICNLTQSQ